MYTGTWSSPAFLKRDRPLSSSFPVIRYDPFQDDEEFVDQFPRKRIKFGRDSAQWRFVENSQSPERDRHVEPNQVPVANLPSSIHETDKVLCTILPEEQKGMAQELVVEGARELDPSTSDQILEQSIRPADQQSPSQGSFQTPAITEIPDTNQETLLDETLYQLQGHVSSETRDTSRHTPDDMVDRELPPRIDLISASLEEPSSSEKPQETQFSLGSGPTAILPAGETPLVLPFPTLGSITSPPLEGPVLSDMPTFPQLLPSASSHSPFISPLIDRKGRTSPHLDTGEPSSLSIDGENSIEDVMEGVEGAQTHAIIADFGLDGSAFSSAQPSNRSLQGHQNPILGETQILADAYRIVAEHEVAEAAATQVSSSGSTADLEEGDTDLVSLSAAPVIGSEEVGSIVEVEISESLATVGRMDEKTETQGAKEVEVPPNVSEYTVHCEDLTSPLISKAQHGKVFDRTAEHSSAGSPERYEIAGKGRMQVVEDVVTVSALRQRNNQEKDIAQAEEEISKVEATLPVKPETQFLSDKGGTDMLDVGIEPFSELDDLKEIPNSTEGEDEEFVVSSPMKTMVQIVDLESETEDDENVPTPRPKREVSPIQPEESLDWTIDSTSEVQQLALEINAALERQSRENEQDKCIPEHDGENESATLHGADDGEQRSVVLQDLFPNRSKQHLGDEELQRQRSDTSEHSQIKEDTPSPQSPHFIQSQELQYSIPTDMLQTSSLYPRSSYQLITPDATQHSTITPDMYSTSIPIIQDSHDLPTPHMTQDTLVGLQPPTSPIAVPRPSLVERLAERRRASLRAGRGSSPIPESISPWFTNRKSSPLPAPSRGEDVIEHPNGDVPVSPVCNDDSSSDNDLPPVTDLLSSLYSSQQSQPSQRTPSQTPRPPTRKGLTPPVVGLRTSLSYFAPLCNLMDHYTSITSVLALAVSNTSISRAKSGQRDFYNTLYITDRSVASSAFPLISVQIFRRKKDSFPILSSGDVVLLRDFKVVSRGRRMGLLSTDTSAWAVFWKDHDEVQIRGPPVEWGQEESIAVERMRDWWGSFDKGKKRRIDAAIPKEKGKGKLHDSMGSQKSDNLLSSNGPNADQDGLQDAFQYEGTLKERSRGVRRQSTASSNIDSIDSDRNWFQHTQKGVRYTDEPEEKPASSQQSSKRSTQAQGVTLARTGIHELRNGLRYTDEPEERPQTSQNSRKRSTRSQSVKQESQEMSGSRRDCHYTHEAEELKNSPQHMRSASPAKRETKETFGKHKLRDGTRYTDEPEERPQSSQSSQSSRKRSNRYQSIFQDSQDVPALRHGTRYTDEPEDRSHSSRKSITSSRKAGAKKERRF